MSACVEIALATGPGQWIWALTYPISVCGGAIIFAGVSIVGTRWLQVAVRTDFEAVACLGCAASYEPFTSIDLTTFRTIVSEFWGV